MKFFDRKQEIADLCEIRERGAQVAQFTVVTGRRRVGKTTLMTKALEDRPFIYLFVERKSEKDLCETFVREINEVLDDVVLGAPERFEEIFEALMKYSRKQPITVVIDEFQEFRKVNIGIFSTLQKLWDRYKHEVRRCQTRRRRR